MYERAGTKNTLFDCHTHTFYSHDSQCDPMDSLHTAKVKALAGFAITDHCDVEYCERPEFKKNIEDSVICAHRLEEEAVMQGEDVLAGVEMGEAVWNHAEADRILSGRKLDLVLGSVHAVRYKKDTFYNCFSCRLVRIWMVIVQVYWHYTITEKGATMEGIIEQGCFMKIF